MFIPLRLDPRVMSIGFQKIILSVAPRTTLDFVLRSLLLVGTFVVVDTAVMTLAGRWTLTSPGVHVTLTFLIGLPFGVFVMAVMWSQRELQEQLAHLAATDFLTGLPNRRSFLTDSSLNDPSGGVVLLVDADHFKAVNDTYGHDVGDRCLKALGEHLRRNIRAGDVAGRIGGEEFAVYLRDLSPSEARLVAERICSPVVVDEISGWPEGVSLTVSVGAARQPPGVDVAQVLQAADEALYRAKSKGRARVEWSSELRAVSA